MKKCVECEEIKPYSSFYRAGGKGTGFRNLCIPCYNFKGRKQIDYIPNPKDYKIIDHSYEESLYERQKGCCAICKEFYGPNLILNKANANGHVRGLLCKKCHFGVGLFGGQSELIERAILYLKRDVDTDESM